MFDLNKLGDMAKIAQEAKAMQKEQERTQKEQADLLRKISSQLAEITTLLKERK